MTKDLEKAIDYINDKIESKKAYLDGCSYKNFMYYFKEEEYAELLNVKRQLEKKAKKR